MVVLASVQCFLAVGCTVAGNQKQDMRTRDFCFDWKFFKGNIDNAYLMDADESSWVDVQLPHDWSIEGPVDKNNPGGEANGFFPGGIGWYRKHFRLLPEDKDKKIFINFGGIYHNSKIWINERSLPVRPYGYISFEHDLTPYVKFGEENVIAVRVSNTDQPNCRWYTGSGIYRPVRLIVTDKLHVKNWGTYVTTPKILPNEAIVRVRTEAINSYAGTKTCSLVTRILDPEGKIVAERTAEHELLTKSDYLFDQEINVPEPELWSIENPVMYKVQTVIRDETRICDEYETPFGIRYFKFDKDKGFLLNGKSVLMKGVCLHQDAGCLGAAVPPRAMERRLEVLKSIGCNAIRTSHNPPSNEFLDMCDEKGFVVIDEPFDKWDGQHGKWFNKWWRVDLLDTLRRDRNHPSIVMWSMGNEVGGQGEPEFNKQLKAMVDLTHEFEPTRPVTYALRPPSDLLSLEEKVKLVTTVSKIVDVACCNYQEQWFEDYRKENPDIVIIASESYPYYRGEGNSHKAFYPFNPWLDVEKHDYVAGTFYWTGIDYLGEAVAGWPYHGWNCSLIDTCGWVRPVGELVKSFWTDKPMVHIAVMDNSLDEPEPTKDHWGWPKMVSHWNLPQLKGKKVKVATFTNCPVVELLVNGKSMGTKKLSDFPDKMVVWEVSYAPGRIEARGIDKGKTAAVHKLQTAGKEKRIELVADRKVISADGIDLCNVEIKITDENGILVPSADHQLKFDVQGPGKIVGVDNGDVTSMESYKAETRKAFYGRALVVIQSAQKSGKLTLTVKAEGLEDAKLTVDVN